MASWTIGELAADETDAAIALWGEAGITRPWNNPAAEIAAGLAHPTATILAARGPDGALLGTVLAGYDGHRGWLYCVAVAEIARRLGIGRELIAAAEAYLRGQAAPKVRLMVRDDNNQAIGFYAALGYERQDVVVMGRDLGGDQGAIS